MERVARWSAPDGKLKIQRLRKEFLAARVSRMVHGSRLVAVAHSGSLDLTARREVRRTVLGAGGDLTYTKNSVAVKGLEAAGAHGLVPLMRGSTLIASTDTDEVALAAGLLALSKQLRGGFFVLGALLGNRRILQGSEVARLAALPAADVVHSEMVGAMLPGSSLVVPNVAAYLVGVLQQRVEGLGEGEGAPPTDASP